MVTGGAGGALALGENGQVSAPAFRVPVRHTHCAGAAFSGGLVYGLLWGGQMDTCLMLACASDALRCERAHNEPMPTLNALSSAHGPPGISGLEQAPLVQLGRHFGKPRGAHPLARGVG